MKRSVPALLATMAAGLALAACSGGSTASPVTANAAGGTPQGSDCQSWLRANPTAHITETAHYTMVAVLGASEAMYTPAQVATQHPSSGEVMVAGMMDSSGNSMAMGANSAMDHVEVHICSKSTGKALTGAMPTMTLQDMPSGGMSTSVPVAEMQGLSRLASDTHYGNNVSVTSGGHYSLTVSLHGETGTNPLIKSLPIRTFRALISQVPGSQCEFGRCV